MTEQEVTRWYKTVAWISVRDYVIRKNPICQHIDEDGKRCDQASRVVHHLIDPKDAWELRTIWSNLVAICVRHHQGGQRGETQGYRYSPTFGPDPGYGCEQEVYIHEVNHAAEIVPTGKDGKQFVSGGPNSDALDALMADVADISFEEACDFAETSRARAFVYAMKNGKPFDRKEYPTDAELAYLAKCQGKYGDRDGWNL